MRTNNNVVFVCKYHVVWNKALAIKTHRYKTRGQSLSGKRDLKPLLAVAKRSRKYAWLADFDGHSLQQACINLDKAFKNFFEGRARFPRFKRKHGAQSSYHLRFECCPATTCPLPFALGRAFA